MADESTSSPVSRTDIEEGFAAEVTPERRRKPGCHSAGGQGYRCPTGRHWI